MKQSLSILPLLIALGLAGGVHAETLLVERVKQEPVASMPTRGLSMAQVQARYGTPQQTLEPRGGQKRQWPTINRWVYPAFTVYFEKQKVVDVVANKVDPNEIGPKPAIR
ncbi:hypothetical protein [Xanthomonas sp. GPE 39]|uniref:hypothetical protein n=1 Tax=Xanthomonas sp. GPE 39 TaxID=1583099 RepID=UPI0005F2E119|nr:hypothetical protein [Xanthomonas sp. GPE 39]